MQGYWKKDVTGAMILTQGKREGGSEREREREREEPRDLSCERAAPFCPRRSDVSLFCPFRRPPSFPVLATAAPDLSSLRCQPKPPPPPAPPASALT